MKKNKLKFNTQKKCNKKREKKLLLRKTQRAT